MRKFAIALLMILSIISVSCQIGLGAAVDTEPPKLAIENPPVDAIIRDNFALSGTWSDDGKIASITAKLTRTDGNGSEYEYTGTFTEALIKRGSGTWKIEVPVLEDSVIDGTYQAVVTIKDATDRVTTQSTTFNLDNTPPLVILQRPATDISTTDEDSIDTFGKIFTLEGRAADDNNIDHIDIKIYSDAAKTNLLDTVTLRNVPLSIALDAAKWGDDVYNKIYGTTVESKKRYYCSIEAYDAAQRYPMDGSDQTDADKNGNCTTDYYLYKEVANSSIADLKVTELYSVLNGTSSRAAIDPNNVKSVLNSLKKNTGTFFLNPLNNPTFKLASWKAKTDTDEGFIAFDNTSISFDVEPGLDSYPIDDSSLKVYFIEAEYEGLTPKVKEGAKKLYLSDDETNGVVKITGSSTYKVSVTIDRTKPVYDEEGNQLSDKLKFGSYIAVIEGKDSKDNELLPETIISGIDGYPINIASSTGAPELSVSYKLNGVTTTDSIIYMPKTSNGEADGPASVLTLSGTVKVSTSDPADKPSDFYVLIDGTKKTGISAGNLILTDEEGKYKFENINISFTGESKQHTVIVVAENGAKGQENKSVMYDAEGPVIDIRSVTPIASTYKANATVDETNFINGKITVSVSFADAFDVVDVETNKPKIEFIQGGQVKKSIEDIDSLSYTTVFDTTELTDNAEVTMKITAYDRSGNKKENPVTYKVRQVTDKPVVFPNDKDKVTLNYTYAQIKEKTGTNVFNLGTQFPIDLIDDDGLQTAIFYYASVAQNSTGNEAKPSSGSEKTLSGNKNTVFYDLPTEGAGIYKIWLDVIDNVTPTTDYNKTEIGPFFIQVSSGLPVVTLKANEFVTTNTAEADVVSTASKSPLKVEIKIDSTEEPFEVKRALITDSNPDPKRSDATTVLTSVRLAEGANSVTINDNYPVSGDDGEYRLKYFVTDLNGGGNTGVNIIKFKLDKTKPTLKDEDIKLGTSQLSETDWYASDSILLDVTSTDTGSGSSGVSSVEYSLDNGANWTALTSKDGTYQRNVSFANGTNTLKIRSVDNVGNYSIVSKTVKVDVTAPDFEVDNNSSGSTGNIIYINKEQSENSLVIYGVYKDEESGVNPLTVTLSSNKTATVKYYSGNKAITALTDDDYKAYTDTSNSDKSKIKYWRAEFSREDLDDSFVDDKGKAKTTEKVSFTGSNTCKIPISTASIDISVLKDLDEAELDNISLNSLTKKGIYKEGETTTYFVNPDLGTSYTLTGIANDPVSGVQKVTCKVGSAEPLERDTAGWSFPIDFTGAADGATKTITLNVWDKAGNKSADYVYTVKVDKTAPVAEHDIDEKQKDLKFRIGDYDGDYDNELDVGGKYSNGTYGNASTMIIRGYYPDNNGGSGINKYYYKVFNDQEVEVDSTKDYSSVTEAKPYLDGSGDEEGKIFFETEETLTKYVIAKKSDTFTTIPVEYKYVARNTANGGKEKEHVPSNYKPTVRGFKEGKNFLVIVAEDNVGNTSIDSATVPTPTNENATATTTFYCYSINVDNTLPTFEERKTGNPAVADPAFDKVYLTNGTASKEIIFYIKDADSGIEDESAISIKIGTKDITLGEEEGNSNITIGERNSEGKYLVTLILGKDDLSQVSGYQTILATVTDKARNKSSPQTLGIINRDNIAPTVEITSPEENASVNKTITVSGKATDANEIEKVTLTAVCGSVPSKKEYVYEKGKTGNTLSYKDGTWTAIIDTTQLDSSFDTAGKTATLSVKAKDEAGNETADEDIATLNISVNQHGDRPIITIGSNVDFTKHNDEEIWVKGSSTIYGSVIDDDGIATGGFKIWRKAVGAADSTYVNAGATYTGGSWNVRLPSDASYVLKFEVNDKGQFVNASGELEAKGTKFTSTNFRESFSEETDYSLGDYLEYDDKLYKCKTAHPKGAWNAEHFEEKPVEDFDNTKSYSINDIVKYDNVFYECIKVHSAGDWKKEDFEVCCSDAQILSSPIIQDQTEENGAHQLGLAKNDYPSTIVPICLDTQAPALVIQAISYDKTTWYEDYNKADFYLGGTKNSFYVKVTASDTSGLYETNPISASFSGTMKIGDDEYGLICPENSCTVEADSTTGEFIIKVENFNEAGKISKTTNAEGHEVVNISTTDKKDFSGTLLLTISAKDKAELTTDKQLSRTIDNNKPTIKITAPNAVASTAVVSGSIEGENANPSVYYMLSQSTTHPDENSQYWKQDTFASLSYNIYFDGIESDTATHTDLFRTLLTKAPLSITTEAAITGNTYTTLTDVYVWIKAVDVCGNTSYEKALVVVDPQGNRPTVAISYPDANATLGGTIRVMGTANDNVEAKYAWIQLDIDRSGWGISDYNILKAITKSSTDTTPYYTFGQISTNKTLTEAGITPSASNISDVAIMVEVSGGSWNASINPKNELIPSGNSNYVTMTVYATDNDAGTSILKSVAAVRTFKVDKDTPYFVQSTIKLVKEDGSAEQVYKEGMSVKGEWWLVGEITDDSGINKISVTVDDEEDEIISANGQSVGIGDYQFKPKEGDSKTYEFKVKVGKETGVGKSEFRITAEEVKANYPLSVPKDFLVNYDNEAPTFAAHNTSDFKISTTVKNSQGYYSLQSVAKEEHDGDTGVERVAVFFTRTIEDTTYVFDPMYKRGFISGGSDISKLVTGSGINQDSEDMLYWGSATASSISSKTLTLSANAASYVHAGGLAKVKGVVYRIDSVSGSTVVLASEPGDSTSNTTVYFAVANVVDNTNPESKDQENDTPNSAYDPTTGFGYGYCNKYVYDDGDKIMENLHKDDSKTWTWELYVNSKNISDGDVDIHYVIFDKAGNCTHDKLEGASVENNKPRLVSVVVGLDKNQNGNIDSGETKPYYPEGLGELPAKYNDAAETINISEAMVVKGKMTVKPEVVGGNGEMFYRWKTTKTSSWQEVNTKFMDGNDNYDDADFDNTNDYVNQDALTINTVGGSAALITHDTAWFIANSTDNGTGFAINYEIWDSTDGKTKYSTDAATASNKVSINITGIDLQVRDKAAPVVTIDDFYWSSLSDNSVYTSKTAAQVKSVADLEGHIELHDQLPDTFLATGATDTEFDRDDKVSGKIKLKGTVSDNIVLTDLYLLIDGMTGLTTSTKVATYDRVNGKWLNAAGNADFAKVGTLASNGYEFNILTDSNKFDSTGHSVNWTLVWDTEKIGNVTQNNVKVQLKAKDNASAAGNEDANNNPVNFSTTSTRQVDVVPYITEVVRGTDSTGKAFNTNRARSGAVSLRRGDVTNIIRGYNLGKVTNTSISIVPDKKATQTGVTAANWAMVNKDAQDNDITPYLTFTVPDTAKSGYLHVVVNNVAALNNMNAYQSYNTETNAKAFDHNDLADDRYVHIWRVDTKDTFKGSKNANYPAMSSSSDGTLYASFTNYGQAKSYYSKAFVDASSVDYETSATATGDVTTVYYGYDPSEDTDISVGADGKVNVFYNGNFHGGQSYSWDGNSPSYAGGIFVYDPDAPSINYNTNSGNRHNLYRFELYTYDNELNQFKNTRVSRTYVNNEAYVNIAYYDRLANAIKYSFATDSINAEVYDDTNVTFTYNGTYYTSSEGNNYYSNYNNYYIKSGEKYYKLTRYTNNRNDRYTIENFTENTVTSKIYNLTKEYDTSTNGAPWITIDGQGDNLDITGTKEDTNETFTFAGGWSPFKLDTSRYSGVSQTDGTGESVAITSTSSGYPVILYMDASTGQPRIAFANSRTPTTAANWTVQGVFASTDDNYDTVSDYLSCMVNGNDLHIAFQNTKGQLVYGVGTYNNETKVYDFGESQVIDDSGMWIDMTMNNGVPYISYLSRVNSYDGMKIAFWDANFDEDNDGTADGGWETMTAAMNAKVTNIRTCIEPNAKAADYATTNKKYTVAIGYHPGSDYRAAFYVGQ